ncbi:MAG: hypothetical protein WCG78_05745 [Candidatus Omnitrophota bacterium]
MNRQLNKIVIAFFSLLIAVEQLLSGSSCAWGGYLRPLSYAYRVQNELPPVSESASLQELVDAVEARMRVAARLGKDIRVWSYAVQVQERPEAIRLLEETRGLCERALGLVPGDPSGAATRGMLEETIRRCTRNIERHVASLAVLQKRLSELPAGVEGGGPIERARRLMRDKHPVLDRAIAHTTRGQLHEALGANYRDERVAIKHDIRRQLRLAELELGELTSAQDEFSSAIGDLSSVKGEVKNPLENLWPIWETHAQLALRRHEVCAARVRELTAVVEALRTALEPPATATAMEPAPWWHMIPLIGPFFASKAAQRAALAAI